MDKQKQVEEMAKVIEQAMAKARRTIGGHNNIAMFYANMLYNAGYRKIPEDAVVLTGEELAQIQSNFFDAGIKHGSKATAEKFAEMAREGAFVDFMGEPIIRASKIDEICKGITEGK